MNSRTRYTGNIMCSELYINTAHGYSGQPGSSRIADPTNSKGFPLHETALFDTGMQLTHSNLDTSGTAFEHWFICTLTTLSARGTSPCTAHDRAKDCASRRRHRMLNRKYFSHPLIPDFPVIGLPVHCHDNFAFIWNMKRCLTRTGVS